MSNKPTFEYVIESKSATYAVTIFKNGINMYGYKDKDYYLDMGHLILPEQEAIKIINENIARICMGHWEEITEDSYWYWLELLPPKNWVRKADHEMFFCPEALISDISTCILRIGDKYYKANRRFNLKIDQAINEINNQFTEVTICD